jgi:uncharacterized protein YjbJ (UPF0337 family)
MAASKNNNAHTPALTVPASIVQTMRLVQRVTHSASWGERIARQHLPPSAADFGPRLFRRFDASHAPGQWADSFAQRFVAEELAPSSAALTLAPHAPAQRQLSAARQGAIGWSGGDPFATSPSFAAGSIARSADEYAGQSLISDLMSSGWGSDSGRSSTLRHFPEPAAPGSHSNVARSSSSAPAAPIHRAPDAQPAASIHRAPDAQPAASIHRTPDAQPAAPIQRQPALNRQVDPPASSDSGSPDTADATASSAASESAAPLPTAATRPMTFFRGTPQNPLMRMGLPETAGDSGDAADATSSQIQPPSGELPVVRPARGEQASFSAPVSAEIKRSAEQSPTLKLTSSNTITSSSREAADTTAASEIRREVTATQSDTASPAAADVSQPEMQRQATESSPASSDSGAAPAAAAPSTVVAPAASAPALAPLQRSENASSASGQAENTPAPAAAEQHPASGADNIARSAVDTPQAQRSAHTADDQAQPDVPTGGETAADSSSAAPTAAQPAPPMQRQPMQPPRTASIDTVLPLANRLLQRYSSGSTQGTSGAMPLLRAFAPAPSGTQSARPWNETASSEQVPGSNEPTSASSTSGSPSPVQRSAIIPTLSAGDIQRAPAATPASPAPRAAAPALDWSALPLLQRLSAQHLLPSAAPTAHPAPAASVAAHTISRFALDAPTAGMPLLRMQAASSGMRAADQPTTSGSRALMRTTGEAADHRPQIGPDNTTGPAAPADATGADSYESASSPVTDSPGVVPQPAVIHRSAILPSLTGAAFQPLTLLRVHVPDAPSMAQADIAPSGALFQRMPDPAIGLDSSAAPIAMRVPEQIGLSSLVAGNNESIGGNALATINSPSPVQRSAIVPTLSVPDIQRAPAATPASPAPRAAAPALDWSALPLLQRLSAQHLLPSAAPTAHPAPATSVAAHTISRFALDAPTAGMPLLRMQAPADMPLLSREPDTEAGEAIEQPAASTTGETPAAPVSLSSAMVRRSAILPSLPSIAAQESPLAAPQTEGRSENVQRSAAVDWNSLPALQGGNIQRFFGSRPKMPLLGGLASQATGTIGQLRGQAQGMLGQVTGLPDQLQNQAQGMINQVTGLPNQLMGQAQGMFDQVTGLPNQLMGQAQGMLDQVTGLPNQLMGQAQGMLDQVTGLPNQLMGQAQGMLDQVTGLPNQLMGQAHGMLDQVTGLPNQLMGQAQGMLDQVTGLPNQLMGQAQGMLDQVTGLPNQLMGQAQGMVGQVSGLPGQLQGQAQGMLDQASSLPGQLQGAASNPMAGRGPDLTLLRPIRAESQSAALKSDSRNSETGAAGSAQAASGGSSGAQPKGADGKQAKPDIDMLAQQVYARLRHRLLIDRERLGR